MKSPVVSVIIPLFNRIDIVVFTIKSLLDQSYSAWEGIIVDDGSSDGSRSVVRKYALADERLKLIERNRLPKGAPTCRNIGIEHSSGGYILFLDSDDLLAPYCLEQRLTDFRKNPQFDFLVYGMQFFDHHPGDQQRIWLHHFYDGYLSGFLLESQWAITGPIWKKSSLMRLGGFDEQLLSWQDGDLHRRALIQGFTFKVFDRVDAYCRRNSSTARIGSKDRRSEYLKSRRYQLDKIWKMLDEARLITPLRKNIVAGQYVTLCRMLLEKHETNLAKQLWKSVYQRGIVNRSTFRLVKLYLFLRKGSENSIWVRSVKRLFRNLLPRYVIRYG